MRMYKKEIKFKTFKLSREWCICMDPSVLINSYWLVLGITRFRVLSRVIENRTIFHPANSAFWIPIMVSGRGPKSANKLSLNKVNAHDGGRHLRLIIRATVVAARHPLPTRRRRADAPRRGVRVSGLLNYSDERSVPTKITFLRVYDSHCDYHWLLPITYVRARNYNVNLRFRARRITRWTHFARVKSSRNSRSLAAARRDVNERSSHQWDTVLVRGDERVCAWVSRATGTFTR